MTQSRLAFDFKFETFSKNMYIYINLLRLISMHLSLQNKLKAFEIAVKMYVTAIPSGLVLSAQSRYSMIGQPWAFIYSIKPSRGCFFEPIFREDSCTVPAEKDREGLGSPLKVKAEQ